MPTLAEMLGEVRKDKGALSQNGAPSLNEMLGSVRAEAAENVMTGQEMFPDTSTTLAAAEATQPEEGQKWWNSGAGISGNIAVPLAGGAAQVANTGTLGVAGSALGQLGRFNSPDTRMEGFIRNGMRGQGKSDAEIEAELTRLRGGGDNYATRGAKWLLDKANAVNKAIGSWERGYTGDKPSFAADVAHTLGNQGGFFALNFLNPVLGVTTEAAHNAADAQMRAHEAGKYEQGLNATPYTFATKMAQGAALDKLGDFIASKAGEKIVTPWLKKTLGMAGDVAKEIGDEALDNVTDRATDKTVEQNGGALDYLANFAEESKKLPQDLAEVAPTIGASSGLTAALMGLLGIRGHRARQAAQAEAQQAQAATAQAAPTVAEMLNGVRQETAQATPETATQPKPDLRGKKETIGSPGLTSDNGSQVRVERPDAPDFNDTIPQQSGNVKNSNTARVRTAAGTEVDVRYRVMSADDLIASNTATGGVNPEYPQELQPRQRNRESSMWQINRMAGNLDPELLGENRMASDGAPIIGPDRVVESGNGRVMAIRQAYRTGNAGNYQTWIRQNAARFGLSEADFDGINNPVLVRERTGEVDRARFTREANEASVSRMSRTEQAKADAAAITPEMLTEFDPEKPVQGNRSFVQLFADRVVGRNETGGFMTADGRLSQEGAQRITNALFAKAYGDTEALNRLSESLDDDIKNITGAMLQAAPKVAVLENAVEGGGAKPEFSIKDDVASAANTLSGLKKEGRRVEEFLAQGKMFEDADISEGAKRLLWYFENNKRRPKRITAMLNHYAEAAMNEGSQNQVAMFETGRDKATLMKEAMKWADDPENFGQGTLLDKEREEAEPWKIAAAEDEKGTGKEPLNEKLNSAENEKTGDKAAREAEPGTALNDAQTDKTDEKAPENKQGKVTAEETVGGKEERIRQKIKDGFIKAGRSEEEAEQTSHALVQMMRATSEYSDMTLDEVAELWGMEFERGGTAGEGDYERKSETYYQTQTARRSESRSMGAEAEAKLAADEKAWGDAVEEVTKHIDNNNDDSESDKKAERKPIKVMTTPLVFKLIGAEIRPIYMNAGKIRTVLKEHSGMTKDILKQIPRTLTDPIAIFKSKSHPNDSIVVMTEIVDDDGATVIVSIHLEDNQDEYTVNRISSVYGKKNDKTGTPRNEWFVKQVNEGRLKYINNKKSSQWSIQTGLQLPVGSTSENGVIIPNETDLAKLRNQPGNETYYQRAWTGSPNRFKYFDNDYIGSGEGAQCEGYGFYFSNKREIAEWYREKEEQNHRKSRTIRIGDVIYTYNKDAAWWEWNNEVEEISGVVEEDTLSDFLSNYSEEDPEAAFRYLEENAEDYDEDELSEITAFLQDNDIRETAPGQLYEVEIPEDDVLMHREQSIGEQSETIQNAVREVAEELGFEYDPNMTGEDVQKAIGTILNPNSSNVNYGDPAISGALAAHGLKGLRYITGDGKGTNYVIFDASDIDIIETYYQARQKTAGAVNGQSDARGYTEFVRNAEGQAKAIIHMLENADASTGLHEGSHVFLENLKKLADAGRLNEKGKAVWDALNKEVGVDKIGWHNAQEKFAAGVEKYLATGKAPTSRMREVFEAFKNWLGKIYNGVKNITWTDTKGKEHHFDISREMRQTLDNIFSAGTEEETALPGTRAAIETETETESGTEKGEESEIKTDFKPANDEETKIHDTLRTAAENGDAETIARTLDTEDNPFTEHAETRDDGDIRFGSEETERRFTESREREPKFEDKLINALMNGEFKELSGKETRSGERMAPLREAVRGMARAVNAAPKVVAESMKHLQRLSARQYDILTRKRILDDLMWRKQDKPDADLPWGLTAETLKQEHERFTRLAEKDPRIMEAIEREEAEQRKINQELIGLAEKLGWHDLAKKLRNPHYFHHEIFLDTGPESGTGRSGGAAAETAKAGGGSMTDRLMGIIKNRGYLKKYNGSLKDMSANYAAVTGAIRIQMKQDAAVMRTLAEIKETYDKGDELRAKLKPGEKLSDIVPEGYAVYDPRGGGLVESGGGVNMETLMSLAAERTGEDAEKVAEELMGPEVYQQSGVSGAIANKITEILAEYEDQLMVIPKELKDALTRAAEKRKTTSFMKLLNRVTRGWKIWTLYSPFRTIKYNLRNLSGDADALMAGNPKAFLKAGQSFKDLWNVMGLGKEATGDIRDYMERGWAQSTETHSLMDDRQLTFGFEEEDIRRLLDAQKELEAGKGSWKKRTKKALKTLNKYSWGGIQNMTEFREQWLRYACYLSYKEQMEADLKRGGTGRPDNWGASLREEVMAVKDIRDRAYKMANELMGAYDQVGEFGQKLRRFCVPFYSWLEVNARRYWRLMKNGIDIDRKAFEAGFLNGAKHVVKKSPLYAFRLAKTYALVNLFSLGCKLWNWGLFGDDDDELPPEVRDKPHLTFGRDKNGRIIYFDRIGATADIMDWIGEDESVTPFLPNIREILGGRQTVTGWLKNATSAAASKAFNALNPMLKMPLELATGRTYYPDLTRPRTIRDVWDYLASGVGLTREVRALRGEPGPKYAEGENLLEKTLNWLAEHSRYSVDPKEGAYWTILDRVRQFQERELGKTFDGAATTRRGEALRKLKTSIRFDDKTNIRRYLKEYYQLGGTRKGLKTSIQKMGPLAGLSKEEQKQFMSWLPKDERKYLGKAMTYYRELAGSLAGL